MRIWACGDCPSGRTWCDLRPWVVRGTRQHDLGDADRGRVADVLTLGGQELRIAGIDEHDDGGVLGGQVEHVRVVARYRSLMAEPSAQAVDAEPVPGWQACRDPGTGQRRERR